jgi:hypothetical protein
MISLSPSAIYFTHSRLDEKFSGCGKRISDTLQEVLSGQTRVEAIPHITVLAVGARYVSLNNRRLFLFKELLRLGRLPGGEVPCRLKKATPKEEKKYSGDLALVAKLNKCGGGSGKLKPAAGKAAARAAGGGGGAAARPAAAAAAAGGGGGGEGSDGAEGDDSGSGSSD